MSTFQVLTFNVGNGLAQPEPLVRAIRASEAAVIGLTELNEAQAAALRTLDDLYPYQALHGLGIPGKGLLSRYPMQEMSLLEHHPERPDLQASVLIDGTDALRVVVAHPPPQLTARRAAQLEALFQLITNGGPTVMMGDFNMNTIYPTYRRLASAGMIDAFGAAGTGRGLTYPVRRSGMTLRPLVRIDYIWHTRHIRTVRAWVGGDCGSDHLPVCAELTLESVIEAA